MPPSLEIINKLEKYENRSLQKIQKAKEKWSQEIKKKEFLYQNKIKELENQYENKIKGQFQVIDNKLAQEEKRLAQSYDKKIRLILKNFYSRKSEIIKLIVGIINSELKKI